MRFAAALLILAMLAPTACAYEPPPEFDASDSAFLPGESHTEAEVQEAEREGWTEHVDSIRFGDYGLRVVQRLNPETGLPAQGERRWGDAFVGISGHKPARYMSANWSPWWFLDAEVRLQGDEEPLPSPTMRGLLVHCGLREVANDRIVSDAVWREEAGGLLQARFTGWRGEQVFGVSLRYLPPPDRTVANLRWVITAQPYDYSDRGHWQRRRWITTPTRSTAIPEEPLALAPDEWRAVLHNRYAHLTSGCVMALAPEQLATAELWRPSRERVQVGLTPSDPAQPVTLVLGDWVGDYWQVTADRFLGRPADHLRALLTDALADSPPDHQALAAYIEAEAARHADRAQQQAQMARRLAERAWEDG
jgi:hypothetical protein